MSDMMTPISFDKLVNWILEEHKKIWHSVR